MKKTIRLISLVLCSILFCLIVSLPISAKVSYNDIKNDATEELKAQLDEFDKIKKDLKAQLAAAEDLQASAEETRDIYITLQAIYADEIELLQEQEKESAEALEAVNAEIAELSAEYENVYAQLQTILRTTYEGEDANYFELILGASSISDFFSRLERAGALISHNNKLMNKLEETRKEADEKAAVLTEKRAQQAIALANLQEKQAEIDEWNAANEAELKEIEAELEKLVGEYDEYDDKYDVIKDQFQSTVDKLIKAEEERIKAEDEKRKQEEIAAANKKNGYLWPLPASFKRLSSYFNEKRTINSLGYVNKVHYGIDIPASRGTPVYAIKAGKVITATYGSGYGYYVIIDHGNGITSLYAHCSKLLVSKGDVVARGDTIAQVGSTGNSTGNHLHLEIRDNGKRYDPLKYVKQP